MQELNEIYVQGEERSLQQLKDEFGSLIDDDLEIVLTQQAYYDWLPGFACPDDEGYYCEKGYVSKDGDLCTYKAQGFDKSGNEYKITWPVINNDTEDEYDCCNWKYNWTYECLSPYWRLENTDENCGDAHPEWFHTEEEAEVAKQKAIEGLIKCFSLNYYEDQEEEIEEMKEMVRNAFVVVDERTEGEEVCLIDCVVNSVRYSPKTKKESESCKTKT